MNREPTGIKDKHGVEIFTGDILDCPSWWWGPRFVYLNRGTCGPCKGDSVMSYILAKNVWNPLDGASHNIWNGKEVEVVGRIDKNPELIEDRRPVIFPPNDFPDDSPVFE